MSLPTNKEAVQALLTDTRFQLLATTLAHYRANVIKEIAFAETGVNDPRDPLLTFTPHCIKTERVKHRDRPEGTGFLVGWFRLWRFVVGIQVNPSRAILWDVQEEYDSRTGDTSTLIKEPDRVLDLDPVFKNPLFWYLLALTRSGEKVCPACLLVSCTCHHEASR